MNVRSARFDLLVGSDIGAWIVGSVDPGDVAAVVTRSEEIATVARRRGLTVRDCVRSEAAPERRPRDEDAASFALSAHWPAILTADELASYDGAWNIHPGLLPWGRGYAPVFWALWAGEPAGATLHVMTAGLDKGPIVDRRPVAVGDGDTAAALYLRVLEARKAIFSEWWPRLVDGERPAGLPQPSGGSYHSKSEFLTLRDAPDLARMSAEDLVRLTRALAMPEMPGPKIAPGWRLMLETDR